MSEPSVGIGTDEVLRVAVVGAGWMGEAHLRAYAARTDVRIVGLVTHTPARARELAERYPIEAAFDDVGAMLEAAAPHGISVTTGEHDHVGPATAALERGVGVLVEKPMASSAADARTIAAAAERSGAVLVPGHVVRFTAPYRALARELADGRLGTLRAISSRRDRSRYVAEHYAHVHPALVSCVHDIDLVRWLTGASVLRVRALESRRDGAAQPDLIWAQLELDGGIIGDVSASTLLPADGPTPNLDRLTVYGTEGVASIELPSPILSFHTSAPTLPDWLTEPPDGRGAFGAEIGHFCDRLRDGQPSTIVAAADGVASVEVAEAIIRSAAAGGEIVEL